MKNDQQQAAIEPEKKMSEAIMPEPTQEEICGSVGRVDTVHLTNLVAAFSKLYGTTVTTKVANDGKVAAERRLIQAIRANLDRYNG